MVTLSFYEVILIFVIFLGALFIAFKMNPVVYVKDKNFYAELRKEILDSISEDERQKIFKEEYHDIVNIIKNELIEEGYVSTNQKVDGTPQDQAVASFDDLPDLDDQLNKLNDE